MRAEADARPIAYPLGSGQGEEVALVLGLKPAIRQHLHPASLAATRSRFEQLGLVVAEAECRVHASVSSDGGIERVLGAALIVGRDSARVRAIAECERRLFASSTEGATTLAGAALAEIVLEQGRLLGYPRCCVEAFVTLPLDEGNPFFYREALARTRGAPSGRLNVLDQGIFHYISWLPCSFDCELSRKYAGALASRISAKHAAFVARIDDALAAHRLMALEDVQVSMAGRWDGRRVHVDRAWPTARDRAPQDRLEPDAREAAARLSALIEAEGSVSLDGDTILLGTSPLVRCPRALLVPFGPRA
jgi:hypothetical protein